MTMVAQVEARLLASRMKLSEQFEEQTEAHFVWLQELQSELSAEVSTPHSQRNLRAADGGGRPQAEVGG